MKLLVNFITGNTFTYEEVEDILDHKNFLLVETKGCTHYINIDHILHYAVSREETSSD